MTKWRAIFYEDMGGQAPVEEFINSRDDRNQAKIMALLSMLEEKGPILPRPYADILRDGIHELRIKLSGQQTRILYFFVYTEYIILTHAFIKTSDRVPESEIKKAIKMREDFLSRYTADELRKENRK